MARHLLNRVCQLLQVQASKITSYCAERNVLSTQSLSRSNINYSSSYCVYRYWHSLRQGLKFDNNVHGVQSSSLFVDCKQNSMFGAQLSVRYISQSSHSGSSATQGKTIGSSSANSQDKNKNLKFKKKPSTKSSVKEFIIKENISDHDMSIKLDKMQNLLEKGKVLEIFIKLKTSQGSGKETTAGASRVQKQLQEGLVGIKPLRTDYSNKNTVKLTAMRLDELET